MDVNAKTERSGVETNVIARSDDHATTTNCNDLRGLSSGRRCGRLRSRKNSAALRFSAHIHRPYSVVVVIQNRGIVVAIQNRRAIVAIQNRRPHNPLPQFQIFRKLSIQIFGKTKISGLIWKKIGAFENEDLLRSKTKSNRVARRDKTHEKPCTRHRRLFANTLSTFKNNTL
jgi:hypothetical protein